MSTQHTPGPWIQGTSNAGKECVWLDGRTEPKGEMGPSDTWIDCCTEANARLIAAAPDLLEALKAMLSEVEGCGCSTEKQSRDAIAKAEGVHDA